MSRKKILHGDDVERWRDLVSGILTPEFDVVSVKSCDAVLPRLSLGDIDLLLLDLLMPGSGQVDSGYEVLQAVRKSYPDLPVCMFTGAATGSNLTREQLEEQWSVNVIFKDDGDANESILKHVRQLLAD